MKCVNCGAVIPRGRIYCPFCGMEIQIVPDYNPLDDVLTGEVRQSVRNATRPSRTDGVRNYHVDNSERYAYSSGMSTEKGFGQTHSRAYRERKMQSSEKTGQDHEQNKKLNRGNDHKRRRKAKQRRLAKMRRQRRMIILVITLFAVVCIGSIVYLNSYAGQIRKGNKALLSSDYAKAEQYFTKASKKDRKRPEAYEGLAKICQKKEDMEGAENVFLSAIAVQPDNVKLYQAIIDFYLDTKQPKKVSEVLSDCRYEEVLESLKKYVTPKPEFDLLEGTYEEVQEVALTSKGNKIYYTMDGSDPDIYSQQYDAPILIDKEGETNIKAIAVNKNKIPSVVASKKYMIALPIEDAPSVSPSTGQYETATEIKIVVPEGYTAYYTMDGTDPSAPASNPTKYEGPITMPEGQTLFSAVLKKNDSEKYTQVTKRNYVYSSEAD